MNKYLPLAVVAVLLLMGIGYYFTKGTVAPVGTPEQNPLASTTPENSATESSESSAGMDTELANTSGLPEGIKITGITYKRSFIDPKWHFSFSFDASADNSVVRDEEGDVTQFSLQTSAGSIMVNRNRPIAEPAQLSFTTSTRTIAGQTVDVHTFANPNETYVSYTYFTLVHGGYEYYFSIRSKTTTEKFTDSFISSIIPHAVE